MAIVTERPPTDWNAIDWQKANKVVNSLRQRIFRASRQGDLKKVRSLQKLMLRSYSNTLLGVRRVTQVNEGRNTPGVDKLIVKTPERRAWLVDYLMTFQPWKVKPNRRVYIPKASGKLRPLGIPSIVDRAIQARVKNALEPFWEARFEGCSYGFRPGRSQQDAISRIFITAAHKQRTWVLDADIEGAFDNIDHDYLLKTIGNFPARGLIRQWLKAGYVDRNVFHDTEKGTPQGGVVSPTLANIALHGMEEALGITYNSHGQIQSPRTLVRYADDFVILTKTRRDAETAYLVIYRWLEKRGLKLNDEKTRIVELCDGFDFLGFNVRLYNSTPHSTKERWTLLIKPSKESARRVKVKLREEWKKATGRKLEGQIPYFNRIIRGWANYYCTVVSSETFKTLDFWMWNRAWRYTGHRHKDKSKGWRMVKSFGKFNPKRNDCWVFGDKQTGAYVWKFQWTGIRRHVLVKGTASPDDPNLKEYWERRIKAKAEGLPVKKGRIAQNQGHRCPVCGEHVYNGEELEVHHVNGDRKDNRLRNLQLLHYYCHQQVTAKQRKERGK